MPGNKQQISPAEWQSFVFAFNGKMDRTCLGCTFTAIMFVLVLVGWVIVMLYYSMACTRNRARRTNAKNAVKIFNRFAVGRGVTAEVQTQPVAGSRYPEYFVVFTIENPGVFLPDVELPPEGFNDHVKQYLDRLSMGEDIPMEPQALGLAA